jgi:hypothetical protein
MKWIVKSVKPLDDYRLALLFTDGKQGIYDVKPLLDFGVFRSLKDKTIFNSVRVETPSIAWVNDVDIAPETLYEDCIMI